MLGVLIEYNLCINETNVNKVYKNAAKVQVKQNKFL